MSFKPMISQNDRIHNYQSESGRPKEHLENKFIKIDTSVFVTAKVKVH